MQVREAKFNEDNINDLLVDAIERLSIDDYAFIKHLKHTTKSETLDIVVLLEKDKFTIDHLYDALNYRISNDAKIPTFFRSQDKRSFLFPGGCNIHFMDFEKFRELEHDLDVIAGVVEEKHASYFRRRIKDVGQMSFMLVINENAYYDLDKEIDSFWRPK